MIFVKRNVTFLLVPSVDERRSGGRRRSRSEARRR
jgi:hypothetical protein